MNPPSETAPATPPADEAPLPTREFFNGVIADLQSKYAAAQAQEKSAMELRLQIQGALNVQISQRNLFFPVPKPATP